MTTTLETNPKSTGRSVTRVDDAGPPRPGDSDRREVERTNSGYRDLKAFRLATIIYDGTYWFCERFLESQPRLAEQMVQAARSGRQNIAEGSRAAGSSSQSELRLTNVARASLEELLLDYEDFLRHRRLRAWAIDDAETKEVRRLGKERGRVDRTDQTDRTDRTDHIKRELPQADYALYEKWLDHVDPAVRANCLICLIHQANYLLDRQLAALEKAFVEEGGYSDRLAAARMAHRAEQRREKPASSDSSDRSDQSDPSDLANHIPPCPKCGSPTALRTARSGPRAGKQFWGCTAYPECKGVATV